jgi:hypothetical protein
LRSISIFSYLKINGINHPFLKSPTRIDGETLFPDIHTSHIPNNAQNGNQGSKWGYFSHHRIFVTGLNGAVLVMFFRISSKWAQNRQ